jgi:hypothetical protein
LLDGSGRDDSNSQHRTQQESPASRLISDFVAVENTSDFAQDSVDANDMAEEDFVCLDARDLAI